MSTNELMDLATVDTHEDGVVRQISFPLKKVKIAEEAKGVVLTILAEMLSPGHTITIDEEYIQDDQLIFPVHVSPIR